MSLLDMLKAGKIKLENVRLSEEVLLLNKRLDDLGYTEYAETKHALDEMTVDMENHSLIINELKQEIEELTIQSTTKEKQLKTSINKIYKNKEILKAIEYSIGNFFEKDVDFSHCKLNCSDVKYVDEFFPTVILKLNSMNVSDLRIANNINKKEIEKLLEQYKSRYTTKTNKTIYTLMVIALQAELQNILVQMKYEKLDVAIESLKEMTSKYLSISSEGNQSIAGTITKFIGEIEYLFINSIKIEYNYYVKKEQAKQEQLALKAQMRQESEERKALEIEQKKIQKEEEKYNQQMIKLNEQLVSCTSHDEIELLKKRLMELETQLSDVVLKKEEIKSLQNGKAGTVYIISNLGSFGEDVFKVGMTRRLDPMDRVNELGDASVPFKFDVHSFIFSNDAVNLESRMHKLLNGNRLNKVNMRKEFFKKSIDELESIVLELQPTAEFNKSILAEEFRQSLSMCEDDFD